MEKDILLRRQTAIEQRFDEVKEEMMRLQGEHRLVVDLINDLDSRTPEATPTDKPKRLRKKVQEDATD